MEVRGGELGVDDVEVLVLKVFSDVWSVVIGRNCRRVGS